MPDLILEVLDELEARDTAANRITGLTTGHRPLDEILHGLQPKSLVVACGPTRSGKTALALSIASHVSIKKRLSVLYLSLRESAFVIAERLLLIESGLDNQRWRTGRMKRDDWGVLGAAVSRISKSEIFVVDSPCQTTSDIRRIARREHESCHGLGLVVIDSLELVCGEEGSDTWVEQRAEVARELKEIATELSVPILVLARMGNDLEDRGFPPGPLETTDYVAIEASDVVLSIEASRPLIQDGDPSGQTPISRTLAISCLKNNDGRTGRIKVEKAFLGLLPASNWDESPQ
jgi:replicative DNA helicase